jgi:5,5'-dehydrodivanillate O-demethylase
VSAQETEYGSKETVTFSNRVGYVHRVFPNGRMFVTPIPGGGGWIENLIFQVPVDDESHLGFGIQYHHAVDTDDPKEVRERVTRFAANPGQNGMNDIAASVLRGEITLAEVEDRRNIVNLQDLVSQWGQGVIRDEPADHLGRSDAGVVMLRRLWARELRALADGEPPKQWVIPKRIEMTADYHG